MTTALVILAGGEGRRLGGVNKARLRLDGTSFVDRLTASFGPQVETVLISTGHGIAPPGDGIGPALPDLDLSLRGPLAGVVAAIAHLRALPRPPEKLLTASVDTPLLPARLLPALAGAAGQKAGAMVRSGGQMQPTVALWRLAALADLPERVQGENGPMSLKAVAEQYDTAIFDWNESDSAATLRSINTLDDLLAARRWLWAVERRKS